MQQYAHGKMQVIFYFTYSCLIFTSRSQYFCLIYETETAGCSITLHPHFLSSMQMPNLGFIAFMFNEILSRRNN